MMNSKDAKSVLELGLGHGFTTNIFSSHFDRHVVLEGSPAVIQNFKEKFPECRAKIVETHFEEFDTEEKFDVIVMGFVLEHFFFSSRRRHTSSLRDWSSDVCSSD